MKKHAWERAEDVFLSGKLGQEDRDLTNEFHSTRGTNQTGKNEKYGAGRKIMHFHAVSPIARIGVEGMVPNKTQ